MATEQDINAIIASGSDIFVTLSYSSGTSGTSGTSGAGSCGSAGSSGSSGSSGTSGSSGGTGSSGSSGSDGTSGSSGTSGTSGATGSSGSSGSDGSHGTSGTSGTSGSSGSSSSSGSSGTSGTSPVFPWGTDGTFNSLKITGNQTSGTFGYVANVYFGTAATMDTTGVPLGSLYLQTGTASSSDYAGTAQFAQSSGTAAYATTAGNAGTALYATSSGNSGTALYATSAGQSGTAVKATSAGYCGTAQVVNFPYANLSCGSSMTAADTTSGFTIFYTHNDEISGITHTTAGTAGPPGYAGRVQIDQAGTYLITFSAIAKSSVVNKTLEIWLMVDGTNVERSNTLNTFVGNNNERLITVTYIKKFTAGQYFELIYRVNDVGITFVATGTQASPDRPASPSIIVTVNRIGI